MRHYNPPYYNDEDRSDGGYYSSESPEETDSEHDDHRERGLGRGYYVSDDRRVAAQLPVSESSSEEDDGPDSESETETEDSSDRYVPDEYESSSAYDRDDRDSYGDSYDDDDDDRGEYDGISIFLFNVFSDLCVLIYPSSQTTNTPTIITKPGLSRI